MAKTTQVELEILTWVAWADIILCRAAQLIRVLPALAAGIIIILGGTKSMWEKIIKALCLAAGAIAGLYGEWTSALTILAVMMAVDYLTGVLLAVTGKSPKTEGGGLSSKIGFIGIAKKGFIMLIVLVATQLDRAIGNTAMIFQTASVFYYIANEGLSILENADLMGVPFPAFIREHLESMRESKDKPPDDPGSKNG